jgi:oligopeptidase B
MARIMMAFVLGLLGTSVMTSQMNPTPSPPVAKKIAKVETLHGDVRPDDYYWLREKSDPEVISYLEAENAYTEAMTKHLQPLQETIYQEILGRIKQTDLSVPYKLGDYWYYTRTEEGKQYAMYCRKRGSLDAEEEVLLELNELAKGHPFLGLGLFNVSDDGNLLAYSLDTTGFREYRLYLKDLRTGELLPDDIGQVNSLAWAADNQTIYYVKEDRAKRPHRLFRHTLGRHDDEMVYEETDELYRIWTYRTSDRKLNLLMSASSVTTEVRFVSSATPNEPMRLLYPREFEHEYYVDHREGLFYIRTNRNAKNYRLVTVSAENPRVEAWKELLPHRPAVKLEGISLFKDHAVFTERGDGLVKLRVHNFRSGTFTPIDFPEPTYAAGPYANPEFATTKFRYAYQSFITPSSVYEFDMETGATELLKQTEVLGGYDPSQYTSERITAKASDGTMIPISIVHRRGVKRDGTSPLLLYGYGSYGFSQSATFSPVRVSLLDRGVVYALAHIRGGGEMGEQWHDDGKLKKKINTFTDFIACAEHLIREGYTARDRLAIQGGSAGGLLIGAVLNMRPEIFKAAHLAVPFVDVINTMLDESLPLTIGEFLEWGNPKVKEDYDYIKRYCPYTNIEDKPYPAMLITTSLNDSQVMYWEPAKYTAKMRAVRTDGNVLLLKTNMGAGHGGASGRYDAYKEQAFNIAFLLSQILPAEKGLD